MSLTKCKECGEKISRSAKTCPHCGFQKKNGIGGKFLLSVITILIIVYLIPDSGRNQNRGNDEKSSITRVKSSRAKIIKDELSYLEEIPEISWYKVYDNDIVIGFNKIPNDITFIIRGAALRANKAINFGVHVWAVNSMQSDYKPGDVPYYEEATARYGKVE